MMSLCNNIKLRHYIDYTITLLKVTVHLGKKYVLTFVSFDVFVHYHILAFVGLGLI